MPPPAVGAVDPVPGLGADEPAEGVAGRELQDHHDLRHRRPGPRREANAKLFFLRINYLVRLKVGPPIGLTVMQKVETFAYDGKFRRTRGDGGEGGV